MKTILALILLVLLYATFCSGQIVGFEDQGWNANQSVGNSFAVNSFEVTSSIPIVTNYGYNLDYNNIGLFYYFNYKGSGNSIIFNLETNEVFRINSFATYQVSESSTSPLYIEGWLGSIKLYTAQYSNLYSWQTLVLNWTGIDKLVIRTEGTVDYNFDNFWISTDGYPPYLIKSFIQGGL
jgi:hypothetical protein